MDLHVMSVLDNPTILKLSEGGSYKSFVIKETKSNKVISCVLADSLKSVRELRLKKEYTHLFPNCNYSIVSTEKELFNRTRVLTLRSIQDSKITVGGIKILNSRYKFSRLYMVESYDAVSSVYDFAFVYARNRNELTDFLGIILGTSIIPNGEVFLNNVKPYRFHEEERIFSPKGVFPSRHYFTVSTLSEYERSSVDKGSCI